MRSKVNRVQYDNIVYIVDDKDTICFKRKGKKRKRVYEIHIHLNNAVKRYCGIIGYWKKDKFHKIYITTSDDCEWIKEKINESYEEHLDILYGRIKCVKIKKSLLEEGYMPVDYEGNAVPVEYADNVFQIIDTDKEDENGFDIQIRTQDGYEAWVSSENFKRTYPNFLE